MKVVLGLGSNLGDRWAHLRLGVSVLRSRLEVHAVSPVFETAPVGGPEQGPFLNAVVLAGATSAERALAVAHEAEAAAARVRAERWGPRTLDVDVVWADGVESDDPVLTLPHPRAAGRAFVLAPWLAVDPAARLGDAAVADLLAALGDDGVVRLAEAL